MLHKTTVKPAARAAGTRADRSRPVTRTFVLRPRRQRSSGATRSRIADARRPGSEPAPRTAAVPGAAIRARRHRSERPATSRPGGQTVILALSIIRAVARTTLVRWALAAASTVRTGRPSPGRTPRGPDRRYG